MSKNVFKEIEESSKGEAFKGMCEIAHAFMKKERLNAEVEIKNFLTETLVLVMRKDLAVLIKLSKMALIGT